ncbi:MAG: protein translocase subunit SecF [Eubacteriales bacterium]|nr:protein translocase subunit SecF [Eubacteriales bacterium]MDD3882468.1 protein translocase subunit SecF [Eubacteriales bacterium]MDD4513190.1 protein translocase subunit SecF [Eubacteriales bacterium]
MKKYIKYYFALPLIIVVVAVVMALCGHGINYGIDFTGGLSIQYKMNAVVDSAVVSEAVKANGIKDFTVTVQGVAKDELVLRIKDMTEDEVQVIRAGLDESLKKSYPDMNVNDVSTTMVGATASRTLISNAIWSVLIAAALMLIYIAIRFDFFSGIAAIAGLVHDVLIMCCFMGILSSIVQLNSSFIAAMLTIVGYSINSTIVIFDRIRENNHKAELKALDSADRVVISVKECLGRTINTNITTLFTIVTLYILGVDSIREFALPIIIGILAGAYSSSLLSGFVWSFMLDKYGERRAAHKAAKAKKQPKKA